MQRFIKRSPRMFMTGMFASSFVPAVAPPPSCQWSDDDFKVYRRALRDIREIERAARATLDTNIGETTGYFFWQHVPLTCTFIDGKLQSMNDKPSIQGGKVGLRLYMYHEQGVLHRDGISVHGQCPSVLINDEKEVYQTMAWNQYGKFRRNDKQDEAREFCAQALGCVVAEKDKLLPTMFLFNGKSCFHDESGELVKIVDNRLNP